MAHPVERELIKVTAYKTRTKFSDRQDYLGSILNAVMKLTDDDFENLSDDAAEWANSAVHAKNSKEDIPDFDEVTASEDEPEEDADAPDDEAEAEDEPDEADDTGDSDVDDPTADTGDDDDPDSDDEDEPDDDETDPEDDEVDPEEDEVEEKPAPKKSGKKPTHKMKVPPKEKPEKPKKHNRNPRAHEDPDVVLDKWGCMEGSKNSRALALFEKGATAKEVKEDLGGTYYNILKKMEQDGHSLEKEGALIKLTHKDEKAKKVGPKPVAKAAPAKPASKKKK